MDGQNNRGKFLKRAGLVILMGACAMLVSSQASAVLVDHFEDDFIAGGVLTVDSVGQNAYDCQTLLANVLGGSRKVHLQWLGGDAGPAATADITAIGLNHYMDYSNPTDGTAWETQLTMLYDGGATENGHFNLEDCDYLYVGIIQADFATTARWIIVDQDSTDTETLAIPAGVATLTQFTTAFASFTGINWADLKSITFQIDAPVGLPSDYRIDSLGCDSNVPEPLTMLGMFLGLGGVGAYIRKRRMA